MTISVDIPEPIGFENRVMNITIFQLSRVLIYTIPLVYFGIIFLPPLLILIPFPYIIMRIRVAGIDPDIYIAKYLIWRVSRKVYGSEEIENRISISRNGDFWYYNGGMMGAISVEGIGIDFYDDESRQYVYNRYAEFLNGLDFPISVYIYSFRDESYAGVINGKDMLSQVARSQIKLIQEIRKNVAKKIFLITVTVSHTEIVAGKGEKILEERINYIFDGLEKIGLKCKTLSLDEYENILGEFL